MQQTEPTEPVLGTDFGLGDRNTKSDRIFVDGPNISVLTVLFSPFEHKNKKMKQTCFPIMNPINRSRGFKNHMAQLYLPGVLRT